MVRCLGLIAASALFTVCVANSFSPIVSITSAAMSDTDAAITLQLTNPRGRDLTVQSLDYELSHGEMAFPLAADAWTGQLALPAQGEAQLPLTIIFDSEPLEDESTLLHLNGQLHFKDHTGFLGMASMDMTETTFQLESDATRTDR